MSRYTVSIQLLDDAREIQRINVWVNTENLDEAVPYLDKLVNEAWASIRLTAFGSESDTKPE